jgi:hypothetical protein
MLSRHRPRRIEPLTSLVTLLALVFTVVPASAKPQPSLLTMSNHGTPISAATFRTDPFGTPMDALRLLGRRGGGWFYAFRRSNGEQCYGIGSATRIGVSGCPAVFPRRGAPVLNDSVVRSRCPSVSGEYWSIQGFAADGVRTVIALSASGQVIAQTKVVENIFRIDHAVLFTPTPPAATAKPVATILARNFTGQIVYRSPPLPPCTPGGGSPGNVSPGSGSGASPGGGPGV